MSTTPIQKPKLQFKTDLACVITASKDQAGAKPIPHNGLYVTASGGSENVWVHSTVVNKGPTAAKFSVKRSVRMNGSIYDVQAKLVLLAPGEQKEYKTRIPVTLGTSTIEAEVQADADNVIPETTELNNWATITFRVHRVG